MYMSVQRSLPHGAPKSNGALASRHSSFVQTPSRSASTRKSRNSFANSWMVEGWKS